MTIETLLDICEEYSNLGGAVTEQLCAVCGDMDTVEDQNPNALRMGVRFLKATMRQIGPDDESLRMDLNNLVNEIEESL